MIYTDISDIFRTKDVDYGAKNEEDQRERLWINVHQYLKVNIKINGPKCVPFFMLSVVQFRLNKQLYH